MTPPAKVVPCSPCEHGKTLESFKAAPVGSVFQDPACRDSKGVPRVHVVQAPK